MKYTKPYQVTECWPVVGSLLGVIRCYCPIHGYEAFFITVETRLLCFFLCDKSLDSIQEACKDEKKSGDQHNCCADGTGQLEPHITGRQ